MPEPLERKEKPSSESFTQTPELTSLRDLHPDSEPLSREVKSWMQKVEEASTSTPQVSDLSGQPLLSTPIPNDPKIVLPVTRNSFVAGFKKNLSEAGRWLSVFIFRFIKMKKGHVKFK